MAATTHPQRDALASVATARQQPEARVAVPDKQMAAERNEVEDFPLGSRRGSVLKKQPVAEHIQLAEASPPLPEGKPKLDGLDTEFLLGDTQEHMSAHNIQELTEAVEHNRVQEQAEAVEHSKVQAEGFPRVAQNSSLQIRTRERRRSDHRAAKSHPA